MKKGLSILLALCLLLPVFVVQIWGVDAEEEDTCLQAMIEHRVISSTAGLDRSLTREDAALYLVKIMTGVTDSLEWTTYVGETGITDLTLATYKGALMYLYNNKILFGTNSGTAGQSILPFDTVTYQDALTLILRAMGYATLAYPWGHIEKAGELGISLSGSGRSVGYNDKITCAEFLQLLYQAFPLETAVSFTTGKLSGLKLEIGSASECVIVVKWADAGYTVELLATEKKATLASGREFVYYTLSGDFTIPKEFRGGTVEIRAFADRISLFRIPDQELTALNVEKLTALQLFNCADNRLTDVQVPENITTLYEFACKGNSLNYAKLPVNVTVSVATSVMSEETQATLLAAVNAMRGSIVRSEDYAAVVYDSAKIALDLTIERQKENDVRKGTVDAVSALLTSETPDAVPAAYYAVALNKTAGASSTEVTELPEPVQLSIALDAAFAGHDVYYIVRENNDTAELLTCEYDSDTNTVTFKTDILSMFAVAYADVTYVFTDLDSTHWSYDAVIDVVSHGIMSETAASRFDPDAQMTRGMFVSSLAAVAGVQDDSVAWAADNGILLGYGDGNYGLQDSLTREQMAVMFKRYFDQANIDPADTSSIISAFADASAVSDWASEAVELMRTTGLITGRPGGIFDPQGTFTRAEAATVLSRLMRVLEG